jgi:hypothetical protein
MKSVVPHAASEASVRIGDQHSARVPGSPTDVDLLRGSHPTTVKDISYRVLIPCDNTVSGARVLADRDLPTRADGYPGELLVFWLIADWSETTAHLGKVDWKEKKFQAEITSIEFDSRTAHISTSQLASAPPALVPVVQGFSAALPLSIKLPVRPAARAVLTVWTEDFETQIVVTQIPVRLPIKFATSLATVRNAIKISFDFAASSAEVNSFDLHFIPKKDISLAAFEEAFALRRIAQTPVFELAFATNQAPRWLKEMVLGLTVIWGGNRMVSTFDVELPFPISPVSIVWSIPPLVRLKQATLSFVLLNMERDTVDAVVEIERLPLIPLVKQVNVKQLLPDEERKLTIPVVPIVGGVHVLQHTITIGSVAYRPLFQTIVSVTE